MTERAPFFVSVISGLLYVLIVFYSCKSPSDQSFEIPKWVAFDESQMLEAVMNHPIERMHLKLIQSRTVDKNEIWKDVAEDLRDFSEQDYEQLFPYIYESDILTIQKHISQGDLSYEKLIQWYLYRIVKFENDSTKTLNTIISLNPNAVEEARALDKQKQNSRHPIYGMPILLKDNISASGMRTTAGAEVLKNYMPEDAFLVQKLKSHGAIILGKVNLSEWAYFFCGGCPVGYSAIGGQTLNPYGRGIFETGGSSSGSGTSMAANYAVAAVGTETSGSILSPSGKNSIVGLKPTVGAISRSGIVPISSTLDTPGPMTRSVSDNIILYSAMIGEDPNDKATVRTSKSPNIDLNGSISKANIETLKLGVITAFLADSLYAQAVKELKSAGAELINIESENPNLQGFLTLLNADMKRDLPKFFDNYGHANSVDSIQDIIDYNFRDTFMRAPYGQARFLGVAADTTSNEELSTLFSRLNKIGQEYFNEPIEANDLDAILSMNNRSAGFAAVAQYPCLTIPMGYSEEGEPSNITLIAKSNEEIRLYQIGLAIEEKLDKRKPPF